MKSASPYEALLAESPGRQSTTEIQGATTHYWEYGPTEADTTIVFIHGFRGDHHGLGAVSAHLRGVRIISPDLPGFGESEPFTAHAHDIEGYAEWLEGFLDELKICGSAVLLGHSFGSIIVSAAIARGLKTPQLVLVNPIAAPALSGSKALLSRITLGLYRLARRVPDSIGTPLLSSWIVVRVMSLTMITTKDKALRRWIHQQHHAYFSGFANRDSVTEAFEASISNDVSMFAHSIPMPTLLIGAKNDPISAAKAQEGIVELFPNAQLKMLDNVGHLIHYERPRDAAKLIVSFVKSGTVAESTP